MSQEECLKYVCHLACLLSSIMLCNNNQIHKKKGKKKCYPILSKRGRRISFKVTYKTFSGSIIPQLMYIRDIEYKHLIGLHE